MLFFIHLVNLLSFFMGSYSINVFPNPLSKEEEEELILKMQEGDKEARAKLIEHNLRLVAHIVKKFDCIEKMNDDLISIGTIGLIKGIDSFKINKNNKLTTYVARCIENEILTYWQLISIFFISSINNLLCSPSSFKLSIALSIK